MGAWDTTAFGNDDASDFAMDLIESTQPIKVLSNVLARASQADYLEAPDGSQMVAAAAIAAAACSGTNAHLSPNLQTWIAGREADLKPLAQFAARAIQRVRAEDSELSELWQEGDDGAEWLQELDRVTAALATN